MWSHVSGFPGGPFCDVLFYSNLVYLFPFHFFRKVGLVGGPSFLSPENPKSTANS